MYKNPAREINREVRLRQTLEEVLPDHESEAEQEDRLARVTVQELPQPNNVEFHLIVQCVEVLASEWQHPKHTYAARGKHLPVLHDVWCVDDNHGPTLF